MKSKKTEAEQGKQKPYIYYNQLGYGHIYNCHHAMGSHWQNLQEIMQWPDFLENRWCCPETFVQLVILDSTDLHYGIIPVCHWSATTLP